MVAESGCKKKVLADEIRPHKVPSGATKICKTYVIFLITAGLWNEA